LNRFYLRVHPDVLTGSGDYDLALVRVNDASLARLNAVVDVFDAAATRVASPTPATPTAAESRALAALANMTLVFHCPDDAAAALSSSSTSSSPPSSSSSSSSSSSKQQSSASPTTAASLPMRRVAVDFRFRDVVAAAANAGGDAASLARAADVALVTHAEKALLQLLLDANVAVAADVVAAWRRRWRSRVFHKRDADAPAGWAAFANAYDDDGVDLEDEEDELMDGFYARNDNFDRWRR
jgi:hypothetical protein